MHQQKKHFLNRLKESDESLLAILEKCLDGIWFRNIDSKNKEWFSDAFWKLINKDSDTVPVNTSVWKEMLAEKDLTEANYLIRQHIQNPNKPYRQVLKFKVDEDRYKFIECIGHKWESSDGKTMMLGTCFDVTQYYDLSISQKRQLKLQNLLLQVASIFLEDTADKNDSIVLALELIGKYVGADRAYVFSYNFSNGTTSNEYEWCQDGIIPQISELQDVPLNLVVDWVETHLENKTMYVPDVSKLENENLKEILEQQDINSLLAIPLNADNQLIGFVGFDWVNSKRNYELEDEKILRFAGNLVSQHMINMSKQAFFENQITVQKYLINEVSYPVIVINEKGHIISINVEAERVVDQFSRRKTKLRSLIKKNSLKFFQHELSSSISDGIELVSYEEGKQKSSVKLIEIHKNHLEQSNIKLFSLLVVKESHDIHLSKSYENDVSNKGIPIEKNILPEGLQQYNSIFIKSGVCFAAVDVLKDIIYLDNSFNENFDCSFSEELPLDKWTSSLTESDEEIFLNNLRIIATGEKVLPFIVKLFCDSSKYYWLKLTCQFIPGETKGPFVLCMIQDVTDWYEREQILFEKNIKLHERNLQYRDLVIDKINLIQREIENVELIEKELNDGFSSRDYIISILEELLESTRRDESKFFNGDANKQYSVSQFIEKNSINNLQIVILIKDAIIGLLWERQLNNEFQGIDIRVYTSIDNFKNSLTLESRNLVKLCLLDTDEFEFVKALNFIKENSIDESCPAIVMSSLFNLDLYDKIKGYRNIVAQIQKPLNTSGIKKIKRLEFIKKLLYE